MKSNRDAELGRWPDELVRLCSRHGRELERINGVGAFAATPSPRPTVEQRLDELTRRLERLERANDRNL